jgi:gluconolactonase
MEFPMHPFFLAKIRANCLRQAQKLISLSYFGLCALSVLAQSPTADVVVRFDPALDSIVSHSARLNAIKSGFEFTEGATWIVDHGVGKLYFTDIVENKIFTYTPKTNQFQLFADRAGYKGDFDGVAVMSVGSVRDNGFDPKDPRYKVYAMIGPDGLGVDPEGRLLVCTFAGRSIVRYNKDHSITVLADRWEGKRFDGPNDIAVRKDGSIYFTDMVLGMRGQDKDPSREMTSMGIYRIKDGKVTRILANLAWANGLAFSTDENWLYANNTRVRNDISRYRVLADGTVDPQGEVIADMNILQKERNLGEGKGGADGLRVDSRGNIWCAGPGGIWIFSALGKPLGLIRTPEIVANFNFGGADLKTVYMNGRTTLYSMRVETAGQPSGNAQKP